MATTAARTEERAWHSRTLTDQPGIRNGVGHRYRAPAEATRLFLGFADADNFQGPPGWYYNNAGEVHATVKIVVE